MTYLRDRVAAALLAGAVASCGGPYFTVGGQGGDDGGPLADSAPPTDGAIPKDGAAPGPDGGDASAPGDGGANDGGGTDGGGKFTCATASAPSTVLFCADFDEGGNAPWGFDSAPTNNGGKNALDLTTSVSPPAAYASTTPLLLPTASATIAQLTKSVSSSANIIYFTYQLDVKQFDSGGTGGASVPVSKLGIAQTSLSGYETFELLLTSKGLYLQQTAPGADGGQSMQSNLVHPPVGANTWIHVEMTLDRGKSPWTLTIALDGTQALVTQTLSMPSSTDIEIDVGILGVVPPSGFNAIDFDNVVLRGL